MNSKIWVKILCRDIKRAYKYITLYQKRELFEVHSKPCDIEISEEDGYIGKWKKPMHKTTLQTSTIINIQLLRITSIQMTLQNSNFIDGGIFLKNGIFWKTGMWYRRRINHSCKSTSTAIIREVTSYDGGWRVSTLDWCHSWIYIVNVGQYIFSYITNLVWIRDILPHSM